MSGVILVGIAGGTGSGKTTIARTFLESRADILSIGHDRYYLPADDPDTHNFDHPAALESELLASHLDRLAAGREVPLPRYDFATHKRTGIVDVVRPRPVVLVEGILVLAEPCLSERFDLRVWVETPDDIRLMRRIRRDALERGRSVESVLAQYEATVRPMHEEFVARSRCAAHLVLDGEGRVEREVERLSTALAGLLAPTRQSCPGTQRSGVVEMTSG